MSEMKPAKGRKVAKPEKAAQPPAVKTANPNVMAIPSDSKKSRERLLAEIALSPVVASAFNSKEYARGVFAGETDLMESINVTKEKVARLQDGDLSEVETILQVQAQTLDAIFNGLATRAAKNMSEGYLGATETYLRLALKAQTQCRTTLQALAEIKFPTAPTFIRQTNIASQQQVNNGTGAPQPLAREKSRTTTNELLTENRSETLDAGGTGASSGANSKLEPMESINRPPH